MDAQQRSECRGQTGYQPSVGRLDTKAQMHGRKEKKRNGLNVTSARNLSR